MPILTSRTPFTLQNPYRAYRPATSKIIFLSFEGSVTEEEYFNRVASLFSEVESKIKFISVEEDAVHTRQKYRTKAQNLSLSKTRPMQLVEKIDVFRIEKTMFMNLKNIRRMNSGSSRMWTITSPRNGSMNGIKR